MDQHWWRFAFISFLRSLWKILFTLYHYNKTWINILYPNRMQRIKKISVCAIKLFSSHSVLKQWLVAGEHQTEYSKGLDAFLALTSQINMLILHSTWDRYSCATKPLKNHSFEDTGIGSSIRALVRRPLNSSVFVYTQFSALSATSKGGNSSLLSRMIARVLTGIKPLGHWDPFSAK
jgi:hypothetical protein